MKIKEVSAGLSGVIPVASYENLRPSYNMTVELEEGENLDKCFAELREFLHTQFDIEVNKARIEFIQAQYQNITFREHNGKKYPSVTSITDWEKRWKVSEDELVQFGARGRAAHTDIAYYLHEKKWLTKDSPEIQEDLNILASGSLGLSLDDCSYKKFFEANEKDFEFSEVEKVVFNEEHLYSGRYDAKGNYKGKKSIFDFKTGTYHFKQLAAYAICEEGIEQLVVCPIGPTENKSGFKKPDVTGDITMYFRDFLRNRAKFRRRFGI